MKERVTISIDPHALEEVRADVANGTAPNLSAAIEAALMARRRSEALRQYLELWEAEHGPIDKEAEEWADRELDRVSREASSSTPEP